LHHHHVRDYQGKIHAQFPERTEFGREEESQDVENRDTKMKNRRRMWISREGRKIEEVENRNSRWITKRGN